MSDKEGANKIYTRGGDKGKTSLIGGTRVSKAHLRLDSYGTIDELNSVIGAMVVEIHADLKTKGRTSELQELATMLTKIQNDLFNVGSRLACEDPAMRAQLPGVDEMQIKELETWMDQFSAQLQPLKNFILPGGSRSAAFAHIARTVCRRAERLCVALAEGAENESDAHVEPDLIKYVNRLSDYLFVLARHLNRLLETAEPAWAPRSKNEK